MSKIKIQDLAAKFRLTPAQLLKDLKQAGFKVSTQLATVNEAKAAKVIEDIYGSPAGHDEDRILIKKYENRRLYSTTASRHVTLDEVAALVKAGKAVRVVDAVSNKDITSEILTQILLEGGRARQLPVAFLEQLIRLQDEALHTFFDRFLDQGLKMYFGAQKEMAKFYQSFAQPQGWPMPPWMAAFMSPSSGREAPPAPEADAVAPSEEGTVEELRALMARIQDLEQRLETSDAATAKTVTKRKQGKKK